MIDQLICYLLSLLAGMMISVMVVFSGDLNARAGQAMALVIIHAAGLMWGKYRPSI